MVKFSPGIDLDVEVAKTVLGFKVWWDDTKKNWYCCDPNLSDYRVVLPQYSTNVDHAYRIVHKVQEQGLVCHFGSTPIENTIQWRATIFNKSEKNIKLEASIGETLPHAICLAAIDNRNETNKITVIPTKEPEHKTIKFPKKD